jgi:hypothetical protein
LNPVELDQAFDDRAGGLRVAVQTVQDRRAAQDGLFVAGNDLQHLFAFHLAGQVDQGLVVNGGCRAMQFVDVIVVVGPVATKNSSLRLRSVPEPDQGNAFGQVLQTFLRFLATCLSGSADR